LFLGGGEGYERWLGNKPAQLNDFVLWVDWIEL
jgi:hypothetical protein